MFANKRAVHLSTTNNKLLYTSIKKFALNGLSDLIRLLLENIDDALFDLSEKAENDRERNIYFEAMREIRSKKILFSRPSTQQWKPVSNHSTTTRMTMSFIRKQMMNCHY